MALILHVPQHDFDMASTERQDGFNITSECLQFIMVFDVVLTWLQNGLNMALTWH
jgi:hypothetical protein